MEFGAATTTATVTKKHSNGYGLTGRSAYDGVFATPLKLRAPSISSQFDDYREIFGASSGSSIPILELPEITERRTVDDARRSKVDYSMVFGGFENLDAAVPFEELVVKPKERSSFNNGGSARKKVKSGEQSRWEDHSNCSKEIPVVPRASNDAKRISMSYHKVNQGSDNGTNGTTHIAQLHAVPAYTCLIEEVNSAKKNRVEKTLPVAHDTYSGSHFFEGIKEGGRRTESGTDPSPDIAKKQSSNNGVKEGGRRTKSFADPSPDNAKKQSSNNGVKAKNRSDSVDLFYEISNESNGSHQVKEGRHRSKSFTDPSPDSATKQSSNNGVKTTNRSDSIDMFYDARDISNGSNGTHQTEIPQSETLAGNLGNCNVDSLRSIATKCQTSRSGTHEGAAGADSPTYVDDMVDSNSAAAASVAALRKAIEDAQVRMKVAKESMRRKKEGFPDRVKQKSNIELKAGEKKEAKLAYKTTKPEKITTRQTFRGMGDLPQISSEVGKPMMRKEQVRSDRGAKEMCVAEEPVQEAQKKLNSSQAEHKEEVELKEADHKGKYLELKEATNTEKVSYNRNTGWSASAEPEESDHTIEMVKEYCERENDDEKVHADNTSGACEELVNETKDSLSHRIVGETKLIQETTLNNGTNDMVLKVNENGEEESNVTPFNEPKDYESNLCGQGLKTGNKEKRGCKPEEDGQKVDGSIELEERQKSLKAFQELRIDEKNIPQEQKESQDEVEVFSELEECELTEFLDPIDNEGACNPHHPDLTSMEKEVDELGYLEDQEIRNESGFLDANQEIEHSCWREATDNTFSNIYVQEILADIVDHIHDDEGIYESNTKDNELDGNERVQDAWASEIELEGTTQLMKGNESERKDNKVLEAIIENGTDPNYEEIQAKEFGNTVEPSSSPSSSYEPDETEKLSETQVADTVIENDETQVTPEVCSCDAQDDIMVASTASIPQAKYEEPEYVLETNGFCEYGETSAFECGAPELNETVNQMKHTLEAVEAATKIGETDMKVRQNQHQCVENAESDCDPAMLVEETIAESAEVCKGAKEVRIASDEETDENRSNSSSEDILFDNEHNTGASQVPGMSELKSSLCKEEEVKPMLSNDIGNGKPPKVELDKEHLKTINEAKQRRREREREKEKLAVERAIREARERAFADAKERAALEKAASEARQKNISDGRERLGKATSQASEKTPAERAALEAKLKAERAAVERATSEARARALSRALSEKAASDARNKSDKSIGEKNTGASRDNRMKHNLQSKSFSYSEVHEFDGANDESAQRCKARSERHQRIGERVAKALEEKNMRDWLAQKEQEEKNRVAEARDADVKRWSSGKAGNLRALLSTLQYILGPDSGWQPIPLTEIVTTTAVKKAYRKATLCVHPDKLQQRGASVQQKYICEKVFDLLKEAWNRFNVEER